MTGVICSGIEKLKVFQPNRLGLFFLVSLFVAVGMAFDARADDPLDDVDGTEGWDQVVTPSESIPVNKPPAKLNLQQEIMQWESIRTIWQSVRKQYMHQKAVQKALSLKMRTVPANPLHTDDSNLDQVEVEDWGDAPGEQWLVPSSAVDKAIDSEIDESTPKNSHFSTSAGSVPAPIIPPPMVNNDDLPNAFKQDKKEQNLGGGLAPGPADMTSPVPPPPPTHVKKYENEKQDEEEGSKTAAKMLRRQQEEERRKKAEQKAKMQAEAEAGAAAAAKLIKEQQEREQKEQEALRKKAGVKMDKEGQVIDPDLQEEIDGYGE